MYAISVWDNGSKRLKTFFNLCFSFKIAKEPKERRENGCREETSFPNVQLSHIKRTFPYISFTFNTVRFSREQKLTIVKLTKEKVHPLRKTRAVKYVKEYIKIKIYKNYFFFITD